MQAQSLLLQEATNMSDVLVSYIKISSIKLKRFLTDAFGACFTGVKLMHVAAMVGSYETDAGKRTLSHTDFLLNKQKPLQTERTETKTETTNLPHIMLSEHRYVRAQQPQCQRPLHFRRTVENQQTWQRLKIIARVKGYKTEAFGQHLSGFYTGAQKGCILFHNQHQI